LPLRLCGGSRGGQERGGNLLIGILSFDYSTLEEAKWIKMKSVR